LLRRIEFNDLPKGSGIEKLKSLIAQCRPFGRTSDYPNTQDLHELLTLEEVREQTIVWLDDANKALAFCILDPFNNLLFDCANLANYSLLFNCAVESCSNIIKEKNNKKKNYPTLDICSWENDHQRIKCLKNAGFKRGSIETVYFKRPLKEAPRRITLLPGFLIRPLAGDREINAYVDLHQKVFGTSQMTIAFRHSIMASPQYDPQLDLVVQTSKGRLVAFCVCQINESENLLSSERSGLTDPIGVHPDFRKMGLAKALLIEGFVRLRSRGMDFAKLGTSSDNFAMINLAKTLGYLETSRKLWFSKEVR
jgi:mycothiol synthase